MVVRKVDGKDNKRAVRVQHEDLLKLCRNIWESSGISDRKIVK